MPEKVNVNVGSVTSGPPTLQNLMEQSRQAAKETKKANFHPRGTIYLNDIIKWIKKQEYDLFIEKELIKMASSCPQGALGRFLSSLNNYVISIQKTRRQESGGEIVRKEKLDINSLSEEKRRSALKQRMLARAAFEESQKAQAQAQQQHFTVPEEFSSQPVQPQPVQPQPVQPQPANNFQPQPKDQSQIMRSMDVRRKFAQRLSEIDQEQEVTDQEWLKNV